MMTDIPTAPQSPHPFLLQSEAIFPVTLVAQRGVIVIAENLLPKLSLEVQVARLDEIRWQVKVGANVAAEEMPVASDQIPPPFQFIVEFVGIFIPNITIDDIDKMGRMVSEAAVTMLLPYVRESLLELSVRLRIPPLMLPTIDANQILLAIIPQEPMPVPPNEPVQRPGRPSRKRPAKD